MANLVDTSVNGDLRVTGTMFGTQAGNYATCSTAGATAAKTATISGFTLTTGMHVYVKFSENNSAAVGSLTLNISGTGAKPIKCRGGNNLGTPGSIAANGIYEFAYDGTNWEMVGSAVTGVKGANESSYRWGNVNITAENVGAAASSHTHSASDITSGTLSTARGGTGTSQTSTSNLASALINSLPAASAKPVDADYYVSQYQNGGTSNTSYRRRPVSALWEYIKGKISSVLGLTASDYAGKAATAGTADKSVADKSGNDIETTYAKKSELDAKANLTNSVAIFDGYVRRMNESSGWRRVAYKQFNDTSTNINALFRLYLIGSNTDHIGLGDLFVNIRFNSSGSAPEFNACNLMSYIPLHTSIKLKVVGVAGNAVVEVWFRPPTFSMLMLSCIGNGYDVSAKTKDWTFEEYLDATDPEPVEDTANHVYVFSGTVRRVQLNIDSPTNNNLVSMDANGIVKDSGLAKSSVESAISKAGSAIQGVKVNGTTLTPDANKIVNVPLATYSFADDYNASTNKGATVATVTNAINALDVSSVGGDGKYISAISETDGKISAAATSLATAPVSGSAVAITAGGVYTALAAKQNAIPDAGSAANPVHFKDGKAVAGDSINNCKLTLKVGDATVGDSFTANAGADFEYRVTGEQIASALTAGRGIAISGNTVSTNLPLSKDNAVNVNKNVWYIFAMTSIPSGGLYERCWDFLIASNHNSSAQMRLFISPRISASGNFESDSVIQVDGHVTPAQLEKYKLAIVKDSSGNLYCCLCVKHSHSSENRTVQWNLRDARGPSWLSKSAPLSNYTVVSERLFSNPMPSNRLVCFKQTNNAAVGNATQPVYVDAYGRIQACSSMPKFVIGTPAGAADTIYFT